jgi:hypothetical protein
MTHGNTSPPRSPLASPKLNSWALFSLHESDGTTRFLGQPYEERTMSASCQRRPIFVIGPWWSGPGSRWDGAYYPHLVCGVFAVSGAQCSTLVGEDPEDDGVHHES